MIYARRWCAELHEADGSLYCGHYLLPDYRLPKKYFKKVLLLITYKNAFKRVGINAAVKINVTAFFVIFNNQMRRSMVALRMWLSKSSNTGINDFVFVYVDKLYKQIKLLKCMLQNTSSTFEGSSIVKPYVWAILTFSSTLRHQYYPIKNKKY